MVLQTAVGSFSLQIVYASLQQSSSAIRVRHLTLDSPLDPRLYRKDRRSDDDREDSEFFQSEFLESMDTLECRLDVIFDENMLRERFTLRNVDFLLTCLTRLLGCDT